MQKTILIVDDDRMIRVLLERKLCSLNFNAVSLGSADEALARLDDINPDLIVSDILMPGMDGIEFCQQVRSRSEWRHVPFLFISVKRRVKDKIVSLEAGADDYIEKPFHLAEFVARIEARLRIADRIAADRKTEPAAAGKTAAQRNSEEPVTGAAGDAEAERMFRTGLEHVRQGRLDAALSVWAPLLDVPGPRFTHHAELVRRQIEKIAHQRLGSTDAVVRKNLAAAAQDISVLPGSADDELWRNIDGKRSIGELAAICGGDPLRIFSVLVQWLEAGLIKIAAGGA